MIKEPILCTLIECMVQNLGHLFLGILKNTLSFNAKNRYQYIIIINALITKTTPNLVSVGF